MTITSETVRQFGLWSEVTVTSDLFEPTIFWYVDGVFYSQTAALTLTLYLPPGEQADVEAVDTIDPQSFDPQANAPASYPAHASLWWTRSLDDDVAAYVIRQQRAAEGFVVVGELPHTGAWAYTFRGPRQDDLVEYTYTITPRDLAGNEGDAIERGPTLVVRTPDAPLFSAVFDGGTDRVTFDEVPA